MKIRSFRTLQILVILVLVGIISVVGYQNYRNPIKQFIVNLDPRTLLSQKIVLRVSIESVVQPINNPGIIFISGPIDEPTTVRVLNQITLFEEDPLIDGIEIHLFSGGGNWFYGRIISDAMRGCTKPITTINRGFAASAAAVILSAGDPGRRYGTQGSMVILHQSTRRISGDDYSENEIREFLDGIQANNRAMYFILAQNTGHTAEEIREFLEIERTLTAVDALKFGVIDSILARE